MATAIPIDEDEPAVVDRAAATRRAAQVEREVFRRAFRRRERMSLVEWAEKRRYLSPEANALAAESGGPVRYTTALTPYHREPMLALSDPATEYVVCKFPSQDGKTEILNNFIGWRIDLEPGPMLVMQPTREMAETWSKDRLAPMLRDSPALRGKVRDAKSRDADNTILHKKFPGGHLTAVGSNSAAGLASRPIRDVCADEVDRCATSAGSEGDSIKLAHRRTQTFRRGKKLLISSPTKKKSSRIHEEYELGTQEEWHVPCPHCEAYQFLVWGGTDVTYGLKWEPEQPDTAHYVCQHCGAVIDEHHKGWMIEQGRWIAQQPAAGPRRRSFWKNALTSNLVAWRKLVAEWLEVAGKPEKRQQFINTVLCELYDEDEGEELDPTDLFKRQGRGYPDVAWPSMLPDGVAVLTRSVDVQGDRLETSAWGWGAGEESWLIDWQLLEGDPATSAPWKALDGERRKRYAKANGGALAPAVTFVDSGGHHTQEVYAYCRRFQHQQVFAIKGAKEAGSPLLGRPTRPDSARTILYHVGSFTGEEMLTKRLAKIPEPGPGYIHLPAWLDVELVNQFTNVKYAERVAKGGRRVRAFLATGRNEQRDLWIYARAALQKLGPAVILNLGAMAERHATRTPGSGDEPPPDGSGRGISGGPPQRPTPPRRGGFVNGWRGGR